MTRRSLFIVMIVIGSVMLALWLWSREQPALAPEAVRASHTNPSMPMVTATPETNSAPQVPPVNIPNIPGHTLTDQDKQNISKIERMVHAPISFWGKVIDQDKQPVSGADVRYSAANHYFASGDKFQSTSDEKGLFSLTGVEGMALFVEVSKDGYYQEGAKSMYSIAQAQMPTQDHPAIFELRKRGQAERIIRIEKNVKIPRDGTPSQMNLTTGQTFNIQQGDIQVQAWTNDASIPVNSGQHYDWRCKITVPSGGLQPRTGQFDFEAPTVGYQPTDEINMPANSNEWRQQVQKSYFLQLGNGDYARIDFQMIAGGDHFFTVTSYLNPTPRHRNLEYDPSQQANK